jgi:hypothetical protein
MSPDRPSVQVGYSRFSRCCHLLVDLPFHSQEWKLGQTINAVTGTRRLGFVAPSSDLLIMLRPA